MDEEFLRRETKSLLEQIQRNHRLTKTRLYKIVSEKCGVEERQVQRWLNQDSVPRPDKLDIMKKMVISIEDEDKKESAAYEQGKFEGEFRGMLKLLTEQITALQGDLAVIKHLNSKMEEKLEVIEKELREKKLLTEAQSLKTPEDLPASSVPVEGATK